MKFSGIVQKGNKRGTALGYPTANIAVSYMVLSGIYVARVQCEGKEYPAAAFADEKRGVLEAYLLDVEIDFYGKEITVELLEKLRESKVFDNDAALRTAIADDVKRVRDYFSKSKKS